MNGRSRKGQSGGVDAACQWRERCNVRRISAHKISFSLLRALALTLAQSRLTSLLEAVPEPSSHNRLVGACTQTSHILLAVWPP